MGIQEVDIVSIVRPITKFAITVTEPETIRYHLEKAVYLAQNGRPGPVWIDIPLDVQGMIIDETTLQNFDPEEIKQYADMKYLEEQVAKSIDLLNRSERPVILAGNGIRLGRAKENFLNLIDFLRIPVLTTWKSIDFLPEDHPLFFGRPGSIASRGANFIQQNSDWIATIGARLDLAQVGHSYKQFARKAVKVVVDVDKAEIDKLDMSIDVPVCADTADFIGEFLRQVDSVMKKDRSGWINRCTEWKKKYPVILLEYKDPGTHVNTYNLIDIMSSVLAEEDVLVPGSSGSCSEITLQTFRVKEGQRILNSPGLGSMGFGLPASIGACIASNRRRTITIIGDGGLQHNIQELETVARLGLPLKIFILNNNGYASIKATQSRYFKQNYVCCDPSSGLTIPDTGRIAEAYGLKFIKIPDNNDIESKMAEVLNTDGPVICEVMVDPMLQTAPKLSSEVKPDGSIVSKPLEDLWPFLERREFMENMIITPLRED
jgi:acetolactate synthase-1/2/3 large subunit